MSQTSKPHTDPGRPRMYGRSSGKALRARQTELMETLYPKIAFDPVRSFDPSPFQDVWLELGFGGAEHLIWQAEHNPDTLIIGAEPFLNGVAKAVSGVDDNGLENLRLYMGDGREVMDALPDGSLSRMFVLFPDPWPKARHNKRRIITPEFVSDVYRLVKPGGIFRFGSDIIDYVDWTLTRVKAHGGFHFEPAAKENWLVRPDDWPQTRYEAKAIREGRTCHYFEFIRDEK